MTINFKFKEFRARSWGWRQRFGQIQGGFFYLKYLFKTGSLKTGDCYSLKVPGFKSVINLRAGTSDFKVLEQVVLSDELSFELSKEPEYIVDGGANIGLVSAFLSEKYPGAKILALEVDENNFSLLEMNTEAYQNVLCIRNGLWSHRTRLAIENPHDAPWAFRVREVVDDRQAIPALGVADVLDILQSDSIDLLKLDIEGSELEVFSVGYEAWIGRVKAIAVELHDRFRPGCKEALVRATAGRGFRWGTFGEYEFLQRTD